MEAWMGEGQRMLDAMENLMTGGSEYDRAFLSKLWPCMDQSSDRLREANVIKILFPISY